MTTQVSFGLMSISSNAMRVSPVVDLLPTFEFFHGPDKTTFTLTTADEIECVPMRS